MGYLSCSVVSAQNHNGTLAEHLVKALRGAGVQVYWPAENFGTPLYRAFREAGNADRVILLVSKDSLDDGHIAGLVSHVEDREFQAGGESFIIPIDVDGALAKIKPMDPLGSLIGRVSATASEPMDKLVKRLLQALEAP